MLPYLPFATVLGFQAMPEHFYPILALIILAYVAVAEATKLLFYRNTGNV
jgi:Mg2+-importing ATPase